VTATHHDRGGDCGCGCCAGVTPATPLPADNRYGLPQVRYRAGTYPEFRASLHAGLTSADRPALAGLSTRDPQDFTIALLDGVACVADVLTFYTERLAQESYLRTARERVSLAELGKLVGYRLRPGVAAATHLAFHVEPPPQAAVAAAISPFQKMRMPDTVTIGAGVAVRSVPGQDEAPQVFETAEKIEARPEWNLMRPLRTRQAVLGAGRTSMYVEGVATQVRPGDLLLFHGGSGWEVRPVGSVTAQHEQQRTLLTWQSKLTKAAPLTPYVFRRRLAVFGHNAPMWGAMSDDFRADYAATVNPPTEFGENVILLAFSTPEWPNYTISPVNKAVDADGSHPDITAGGFVLLRRPGKQALFTVASTDELSRSEFAVSGKVTRVQLSGSQADYGSFADSVRITTVYAVPEPLTLVDEPDDSPLSGDTVVVPGDLSALPPGRTLLVAHGGGTVETMTLAKAELDGAGTALVFTTDLPPGQYDRDSVEIYGNVARGTHGETVHQILGDGQAAQPFQRFPLKHAPLTYVPSSDPAGAASTLEVRANDVTWHEIPTLYQAGPGDRVFTTRSGPTGEVVVGTGDGRRGVRVPTGQHNIRATYRKGIGAAGNLPAGALTQLGAPPLGVTGVTNPAPATGGADPDSAEHARTGIPLFTRTLGRAVSVIDYADFARTFAGIAKAHVAVLPVGNVRTIVVTVSGPDGAAVPPVQRASLVTSLRQYGDPLAPVTVVPHRTVGFTLEMTVRRHPDHDLGPVIAAVAAELTAGFGFAARQFTQPVRRSEVIAAAHRASGVTAVDLNLLHHSTAAPSDEPRLLAGGPEVSGSTVSGAELLLLGGDPLTWLKEMP
jgi:hypothetical protein